MTIITSAQNGTVKLAASLKHKKYRDETGLFAAEGIRLAEEAIRSCWRVPFCIVSDDARGRVRVDSAIRILEDRQVPVYIVSPAIYAKISDTAEPQGVFVAIEKNAPALAEIAAKNARPVVAVLDGVRDPGNVGTIIRSADAAGIDGVILLKGCADAFAPKTIRAAMGSIFHLPVAADIGDDALLAFLSDRRIALFAAAVDETAKMYFDAPLKESAAIALGNEGNGVRADLLARASEKIFIPMRGRAESLNVAAAATVIFYESSRQRMAD